MVCLELACRNSKKVRLIEPGEIARQMPKVKKKDNPFSWPVITSFNDERTGEKKQYNFSLVPDKVFGLHFPEDPPESNKAFFFLEVDRSTMLLSGVISLEAPSAKRFPCIGTPGKQGLFEAHFGFKNARVLTVAKSPARITSMVNAVKNTDDRKKGSRMFMFALEKTFHPGVPTRPWIGYGRTGKTSKYSACLTKRKRRYKIQDKTGRLLLRHRPLGHS